MRYLSGFFLFVSLLLITTGASYGYTKYIPPGEEVKNTFTFGFNEFVVTNHGVYAWTGFYYNEVKKSYKKRIVSSTRKTYNFSDRFTLTLLYEDGSVESIELDKYGINYTDDTRFDNFEAYRELAFMVTGVWAGPTMTKSLASLPDLVYFILSSGKIRSFKGTQWVNDTSGFSGAYINYIANDTSDNIYAAASTGLFRQLKNTNNWVKVTTYPGSSATTVFVDRNNIIYAGRSSSVYRSTDLGVTWTLNNTGISSQVPFRMCDDAFGNIYLLTGNGNKMFRSLSGTTAWERIDQPISSLSFEYNDYQYLINNISGDSLLYAATIYGVFKSTNKGLNWTYNALQPNAESVNAYYKLPTGRIIVRTNTGIFYQNPNDTNWVKSFPPVGYTVSNLLFADKTGKLYALAGNNAGGTSKPVWKSSDYGTTWFLDSLGYYKLASGRYYVDESGVEHQASAYPPRVWQRMNNQPWVPDSMGLNFSANDFPDWFSSDNKGNIYLTISKNSVSHLYKRSISGGNWTDENGMNSKAVYSMVTDRSGNIFAGTFGSGLFKKIGSTWSQLNLPSEGGSNPNVFYMSVDSSNKLYINLSLFNSSNYNVSRGIYYSTNQGASWVLAGLDSVNIAGMISYGDSTFVLAYSGMVVIKSGIVQGNEKHTSIISGYILAQNYPNPFNPSTKIDYSIPFDSKVTIDIYSLNGEKVLQLINNDKKAGYYSEDLNMRNFASGVYFYRLTAVSSIGSFVNVKKMLLLK